MRRGLVWLLGIYAFILLLVSGVVAPLVYVLMQHLASVTSLEWVNYLAHKPLCQYVDRFRMVGFFCMLPYVCKISGIRLRDLGIRFNIWKYLLAFCGGCLLWVGLFLVFVIKVDGISRRLNTVNSLLVIFLAAFFLAIVEEVVFRGVIFEFLKKKYTKRMSLFLLACIFACLHFSFCEPAIAKNVFTQSLLCAYYSIVDIFVHIRWPYFCCLFLLSYILAYFRLFFNSLWCSIGFHQGLVFVLILIRKKCEFGISVNRFWGTGRVTDAWCTVFVLLVIVSILTVFHQMNERR